MATINVSAEGAALFNQHKATLELLAAIGVRNSDLQNTIRDTVFTEGAGWGALNADGATAADATFDAVSEYVRVLMPVDSFPGVCKWYHDQVAGREHAAHFLGKARIGDQIDVFADSAAERTLAEIAIKKNLGHKKAASQRDAEKAKAKKKADDKKQKKGGNSSNKNNNANTSQATASAPAENALPFTLPDKTPIAPDAPKDARMKKIFDALAHLKIEYETVEHPAVPTVDAMMAELGDKPGGKCKNLFLKSSKSKPEFYFLVIALHDTNFDVKAFSKTVGSKKPMRFATVDVTGALLGGNKGDLSPFCLINDVDRKVRVAVDKKILEQVSQCRLCFFLFHIYLLSHPGRAPF